jgi:hypothetical protein
VGILEVPLMDEVHDFTYRNKFGGKKMGPDFERACARIRQALRRAQRFVIDDDMVRLCCHLAHNRPKHAAWSMLARLPYDTVWLEFSLHEKVREFERMGHLSSPFNPENVSPRVGYLLQKDLDSNSRWIAQEFVLHNAAEKERVYTQPCVMVFDPEGSPLRPVTGSTLLNQITLSKRVAEVGGKPTTVTMTRPSGEVIENQLDVEFLLIGTFDYDEEHQQPTAPAWAQYKVGAVVDPLWLSAYRGGLAKFTETMSLDISERTGVLRYLMVLLATINDAPTTLKTLKGREATRQVKAHNLKYFDHTVVTLSVPKTRALQFTQRKLDEAAVHAHKANHSVRGHWRVIEYGYRTQILCRHEPLVVENGYGLCERCERKIKWIDDHRRGDVRLGIIDHGYRVRTS